MLPFAVELDLYTWMEISRNLLTVIPITLGVIYIGRKAKEDEMWISQKFAHVTSLFFVFWLVTNMLIPFLIMIFLYPDLMFEIGERILYDYRLAALMVIIAILILQVLNYKGYLRKSE